MVGAERQRLEEAGTDGVAVLSLLFRGVNVRNLAGRVHGGAARERKAAIL